MLSMATGFIDSSLFKKGFVFFSLKFHSPPLSSIPPTPPTARILVQIWSAGGQKTVLDPNNRVKLRPVSFLF